MDLLARREYGRVELQRKLQRRGVQDTALLVRVLDALEQDGLLDQQRFLEMYIRARVNAGFGPLRIAAELMQKGVPRGEVDVSLQVFSAEWRSAIVQARNKKFGSSCVSGRDELARQFRFLAYRGFPSDLIQQILFSSAD
nr:regulatory protein RecX [Atopomonas sediminilitoris]